MSNKVSFLDLRKINARFSDDFHGDLSRVLKSGWYLRGEATAQFEQSFAKYCGVEHCVGVANGLDALTLTLLAQKRPCRLVGFGGSYCTGAYFCRYCSGRSACGFATSSRGCA